MIKIDEKKGMLRFPTDQRWLNGEEYAFLIRHHLAYRYVYKDLMTLTKHGHPEKVYDQPKSKYCGFIKKVTFIKFYLMLFNLIFLF